MTRPVFIEAIGEDFRVELTRGFHMLISKQDLGLVLDESWYVTAPQGKPYAIRSVHFYDTGSRRTKYIAIHRVICCPRAGDIVDHINGDSLDNRRENLRVTDVRGNARNRGLHRNNTSGFKGVTVSHGKWCAQIKVNRRNKGLGAFARAEDAALAYDRAASFYFGEFARLNFPEVAP